MKLKHITTLAMLAVLSTACIAANTVKHHWYVADPRIGSPHIEEEKEMKIIPGGIIADNRFPIYDPKPMVRFDMSKAPRRLALRIKS